MTIIPSIRDFIKIVEGARPADGSLSLYHSTETEFDILNSRPFTHFGNKKAAIGRIYWMTTYGGHSRSDENHLYCVRFIAKNPLTIYDNSKNHELSDIGESVIRALEKQGKEAELFWPSSQNIINLIENHGFDCLSYRNRGEGGNSYINISNKNIASVVSHEILSYSDVLKLMKTFYPDRGF